MHRISVVALHDASSERRLEVVKYLVEKGANINTQDTLGEAAVHLASFCGPLEIVKYLVEKGAYINSDGSRALHNASSGGHLEILKYLIDQGADNLDAKDMFGDTALGVASRSGQFVSVRHLLEAGANWDIVDNFGYSPLNCITFEEKPEFKFIKLFIENGAYLKLVDYEAIVKSSSLEVLQDVKLCSQAIVNKYNNHYVPELYKLPVSKFLPHIEKMKIASSSEAAKAIEQSVDLEIQTKGHCNVFEVRHMGLSVFAVRSVLEYYEKQTSEFPKWVKTVCCT